MLQNYNFYRVLTVFLENPTKGFGWKELVEKAKLGPPSTKRYLDQMLKEGVIIEKQTAGRKLYLANREQRKYRMFQTFDMLMRLENSGAIENLNAFYGFPPIILIGSYARGEAVEGSDVDIAVVTESDKYADMENFEDAVGRRIQLFVFSKSGLAKLKAANPSLYSALINGVVISGHLDVE